MRNQAFKEDIDLGDWLDVGNMPTSVATYHDLLLTLSSLFDSTLIWESQYYSITFVPYPDGRYGYQINGPIGPRRIASANARDRLINMVQQRWSGRQRSA